VQQHGYCTVIVSEGCQHADGTFHGLILEATGNEFLLALTDSITTAIRWTTILKFAALAFMSTVGLFFIQRANYKPWNVSGESAIAAIGGGMAIALFSYLGVETAAVAAAKVRDPDRNIPRATIFGTLATAVVYMLSLVAVFGILPATQLGTATAPFSDAANVIFGGTWAGNVMAVLVIIPITDMIVVFSHGGPAATALGVHGLTAAVMLVDALLLLRERVVTTEKDLQPVHS